MSARSKDELADLGTRKPEEQNGSKVWTTFAGIWRDNPDFDALLKEMADLRRETDQAETKP